MSAKAPDGTLKNRHENLKTAVKTHSKFSRLFPDGYFSLLSGTSAITC
jgi:hypothetical protein